MRVAALLLVIEFLDELVWGALTAAWPLLRRDLDLSYTQVGVALGLPALVGCALDPLIGALGDTRWRHRVLLAGGAGVAFSFAVISVAPSFAVLLAALLLGYTAAGAFVSLAQASLVDLFPGSRERAMARWTLAGSIGYVAGPLLVVAAGVAGAGWRGALGALAAASLVVAFSARAAPVAAAETRPLRTALADVVRAVRRGEVARWLATLEAADLLLDVFYGFLALYFVDVARTSPELAAAAVAVWTGAGLVGDAALLVVLRRIDGLTYLRLSAATALAVYPAFLLCDVLALKLALVAVLGLLNSGWYAIPQARLYESLPGRSGTAVAVGGLGGIVGAGIPIALGALAAAVGLETTMWALLAAPVALLALVPRRAFQFKLE
jgi:FSR family fosmidomycin resistance protein-like MFS transporter